MAIAGLASFVPSNTISKKERKTAAGFLKSSEKNALDALSKLNEAQLKYKPSPDRWSVEECMMHIAASEKSLWAMVDQSIKGAANPEKGPISR